VGNPFSGEPNVDWRAFWDNGSEAEPFVRFDGSDRFTFQPGRGFWVIGTTPWQVEDSLSTVPLRGDSTAVIDVHDGWNIISNPLEKDVTWRSVAAANDGTLQALWQFVDGFEEAFLFRSARRGEAYYFLNAQGLDSLRIPYPNAPTKQQKSSSSTGLRLTATDSSEHQSAVRVRFHPEARSGIDPYDQVAPTPRFEAVSLRLDAPDDAPSRRRHLAEEVRPPGTEGHIFDLTLRASPNSRLRLTAGGLRDGPWARAVLVNEATGRRFDLHDRSAISLTPSEKETDLSLRVGTDDFVEAGATGERPARLQLEAPRPNPARDHALLVYALPEKAEVRLTVFDVMGRQVRTVRTASEAGRHEVQFPVEDLASGVYFLRLRAGGEMRTRKLTVVQ
jgi:hypothetical protein